MVGNFAQLLHQGIADPSRSMANGGGKGGSAPAPDYTPMANASEEAARIGAELGREQLAENKRQYDLNATTLKPVVDESIKTQQLANEQGAKNFETFQAEGRPIQQKLADLAMGGEYTAAQKAKQEEDAGLAIADARTGTNQQMNQLIRQGLRYGWSPAKLAAMGGQAATMGAQGQVAAANAARTQTKGRQLAQMGDAYNTYAGLGSSAPAFYNSGTGAGQAASGSQLGVSGQMLNGMNAGNNTIMAGQQAKIGGLGSILNSQTSMWNASQANQSDPFGSILGAGASLGAAAIMKSDARLKENIVAVGQSPNGFNLYEFNYLDRPEQRYRGVMAQEVLDIMPEAVIETGDGYLAVRYDMIGIDMVEV